MLNALTRTKNPTAVEYRPEFFFPGKCTIFAAEGGEFLVPVCSTRRQDHGQQVKKRGEMSSSLHVLRAVAHLFPHCFSATKKPRKKEEKNESQENRSVRRRLV